MPREPAYRAGSGDPRRSPAQRRGTMERVTDSAPQAGDMLQLDVGEAVHGGWCVSRLPAAGLVIFVRHALPGESVRARVTQVTSRFARADAVDILAPSPDRVAAPCRYAGPGGCGGCDWQHASLPAQRELKAAVIRQQFRRLAGLDVSVPVEPVTGDKDGTAWRTTVAFAVDDSGAAGLRRHRSREIVRISRCLIAHPLADDLAITGRRWPGATRVQVSVSPATGEQGVLVTGARPGDELLAGLPAGTVQVSGRGGPRASMQPLRGRGHLIQRAAGHGWRVSLGGFWQAHPGAADALAGAVLDSLAPRPGEAAADLYCGTGLFAGVLARAVGSAGSVLAVDADRAAIRDARHNLREWPWARAVAADVAQVLARNGLGKTSLAVADPPRSGLASSVTQALCGASTGLRRMAYVSCDPATLARDLRLLLGAGWRLAGLRAFDAFPMTHHVECVATLRRG